VIAERKDGPLIRPWRRPHGGRRGAHRAGKTLLARVAAAFRFPESGESVPVRVASRSATDARSGGAVLPAAASASTQEEGRGRFERLLCERFGRFAFGLAQVLEDNRLRLVVRR
jgi:hypothetical protein